MRIPYRLSRMVERSALLSEWYTSRFAKEIINLQTFSQTEEQFVDELMTNPKYSRIRPVQIRAELLEFMYLVKKLQPTNVLEIGSANGGTLLALTMACHESAHIMTIDLPTNQGGSQAWRDNLYTRFALKNQTVSFIRADSHDAECVTQVHNLLGDHLLDVLFIDGDHSYEGVKQDFDNYRSLVSPDGIIVFHDIVRGPQNLVGGVPVFWAKLKTDYKFKEIVFDKNQNGYGIGVIWIDTAPRN